MAKGTAPEIVSLSSAQVEELLVQLAPRLPAETYRLVEKIVRTFQWLMGAIEAKDTTIGRLARMIFGAQTEKTGQLFPQPPPTGCPSAAAVAPPPKRKGHGRTAAADYPGAQRVPVPHPQLRPGDRCPDCQQGKLYRFGGGLPHYRLDRMQSDLGVRLPASTQWELMAKAGPALEPVQEALITLAAQGHLIHNDDTPMRVQSLANPALREGAAAEGKERTGIFTTSLLAEVAGHRIALFITGHHHAGENLDQLLARRAPATAPPIQMCDALSRNPSKEFETLLANCLSHGRRQFVDLANYFPAQCRHVLESLGEVYHYEAQAKAAGLSPEARLRFHQEHSQKVMDDLQHWMDQQLEQKRVEPNSGLGQAIHYMLKRWPALTLFLRQAGAPLDNNICERALKMAILHRKNSLGYKTLNGARLGDLFMSLIHTCRLCAANPLDYLNALQRHAKEAREHPTRWFPWNYRQALPAGDTG